MNYIIESEQLNFTVSYRGNSYILKRFATLIAKEAENTESAARALKGFRINLVNSADIAPGDFELEVSGKNICLRAGTYHGFEAFLAYLSGMKEDFRDGFVRKGNYRDALGDLNASGAYVYEKPPARIMSYNVLWGHPDVGERNRLQAEIISQYRPDVLGLQECADNNRVYAGDCDIISLLGALGYRESTDPKIAGTYRRRNVSPILYNTDTTSLVYSESHIYKNQQANGETRILTWAVLNTAGERYIVLNSQLEGGNIVVGLEQVREIELIINDLHKSYRGAPVFLIGDFNFTAASNSYAYMTGTAGYVNVRGLASRHSGTAKSYHPYPAYDPSLGIMMPAGGAEHDPRGENSFDHIFLAKGEADVRVYGIAVDQFTMSASDHFPVFADFGFINK